VRAFAAGLLLVVAPVSTSASATGPATFDVPPGTLRAAIVEIGMRAGVTIGLSDFALGLIPVAGVHGRSSVAGALRRLLAGSAATFVQVDKGIFRIVRRPSSPVRRAIAAIRSSDTAPGEAIVVTGSKRSAALGNYAGGVQIADLGAIRAGDLAHGSEALVSQLPVLSSTHLGLGRDKLFIRGIADSSFNGPTQATVGQYLGDVRLNFNAPDPDLALYDVASIEVLEGPQGTLYGAGSLGGVIRFVPVAPDLDAASFSLSAGGSATAHGAPGGDIAGIADVPIVRDTLGVRAVAYAGIDGGYIDDPSRRRADINGVFTRGARLTLRYRPAPDWTIDLGGVVQNIDARDGQYTVRDLPPLETDSVIAQPFDNDYALASVVVRHAAGAISLVSATSIVWHDIGSTYDASLPSVAPTRYNEKDDISIVTNETRVSQHDAAGGGWVIGVELLRSVDRLRRVLGPIGAEGAISGTRNTIEQASLFGEATFRIAPRWFATAGARIGYTHLLGEVLDDPDEDDDQHRNGVAELPSLGVVWKASHELTFYARYQEGFRPGGLSVQASGTQRFESDSVATSEAGLRYASLRFSGSLALSYAHWEDIQADLVDRAGLPYTANIGSGRILGFEARATWRPLAALSIDGAVFADRSRLNRPAPAFAGEQDATLPNIPDLTARLGADYGIAIGERTLELSGSVRYVGRSRLGVGPLLDLRQGRYFDTALGAKLPVGRFTLSLDATNVLDRHGNIFALGNPFGVTTGLQKTPLRPRTIRLGAAITF
jgi:iron complex outermembrane receptor protein